MFDHLFKICLVGNLNLLKLMEDKFVPKSERTFVERYLPTIGIEFIVKDMVIADKQIKVQLWFVDSSSRFGYVRNLYYAGSHGLIYAFDTNDDRTIQSLDREIQKASEENFNYSVYILGIKSDDFELSEKPQDKDKEDFEDENISELRKLADHDIADIIHVVVTKYEIYGTKYFKIEKESLSSFADILNELVNELVLLED